MLCCLTCAIKVHHICYKVDISEQNTLSTRLHTYSISVLFHQDAMDVHCTACQKNLDRRLCASSQEGGRKTDRNTGQSAVSDWTVGGAETTLFAENWSKGARGSEIF